MYQSLLRYTFIRHKVSREETAEFITRLAEWIAVGGLEAVHVYLMAYPLSEFTPYRPPFSVALGRMEQASISEEQNEAEIFTGENPAFAFQAFMTLARHSHHHRMRGNGYVITGA